METFWGHMKNEMEYNTCSSIQELRAQVEEYISYYNPSRK
ncbi:IS3 family transposase [Brevibacillus brevis]|nr:IS3 family transposase [Brevibacillus brevis]PSJ66492.1 hypothetical protein C7J99_25430 [Brevibacillus brevis]